jgi:hypothetical protein
MLLCILEAKLNYWHNVSQREGAANISLMPMLFHGKRYNDFVSSGLIAAITMRIGRR